MTGASWLIGVLGAIILFLYGIVPTYQPAHFGRVYAAYGGWFVVLSILWGWGGGSHQAGSVRCPWRLHLPSRRGGDHVKGVVEAMRPGADEVLQVVMSLCVLAAPDGIRAYPNGVVIVGR